VNEPAVPYVLTNRNSPAFWLTDNLWMPLAGSFLTNGNFCLIEQVCGVGIGGPCTHAHPSDEGLYVIFRIICRWLSALFVVGWAHEGA
jgi:hypothetical protein